MKDKADPQTAQENRALTVKHAEIYIKHGAIAHSAKSTCPHIVGLLFYLLFLGLFLPPAAPGEPTSCIPIKNFIFIIQENHSFDHYFGTFPGANGIPDGAALPDYPGGPLVEHPFLGSPSVRDMSHGWVTTNLAYHGGAMDGFFWAEWPESNLYYGTLFKIFTPQPNPLLVQFTHLPTPTPTPMATPGPPPPLSRRPSWVANTFSYVDYTIIPNYWEYAQKYTLCDAFFSALEGPSLPNHLYTIAAQSGGLVFNPFNYGRPEFFFPCVVDFFDKYNINWKYYVGGNNPGAQSYLNPLPGFQKFEHLHHLNVQDHIAGTRQFYADIHNGTLPQVSYLIANGVKNEHPPYDIRIGMWYVTHLLNAVMQSSYWQKCAIIIVWDDYGGFYDHVPPPKQQDELGDGFRVPALVISPYSKVGINHTTHDLTSLLKLIETAFSLTSMTPRDGQANNMLDCFNFSQLPLSPDIITPSTKLDFSKLKLRKP